MIAAAATVALQPLEAGHAAAMYGWMLDGEVASNLGLRSEPTLERTQEWIARASGDEAFLPLAIYWMDRHVGNVIFDRIEAGSARLSVYIGEAEARGRGIGTMALAEALENVFSSGRFEAVWLTVHVTNARARHVYEKLGFRVEGEAVTETVPSTRMVITRGDWRLKREGQ